jgi:hypothetical protein
VRFFVRRFAGHWLGLLVAAQVSTEREVAEQRQHRHVEFPLAMPLKRPQMEQFPVRGCPTLAVGVAVISYR